MYLIYNIHIIDDKTRHWWIVYSRWWQKVRKQLILKVKTECALFATLYLFFELIYTSSIGTLPAYISINLL